MMQSSADDILYVTFNQDSTCFACGTEFGFKIFTCYPFRQTFTRDMGGGIAIIEMLYRSNILALVGGGKNPKYPPNKVMVWDDNQTKCIGEMSFRSDVKAVRMRQNKIIVVLDTQIFVYNFSDLRLLEQIDTCLNPKGLCSINLESEPTVIASPDKAQGHVTIRFYGTSEKQEKKIIMIKAHQSALSGLELNHKGNKLATASEKGTIIRIYNTNDDGSAIQELRRGSEQVQMHSLSFESTGRWLICTSDSGTVHLFNLKLTEQEKSEFAKTNETESKNPKSKFSFIKSILPFFDSEWSFAQFRIPDSRSIATFTSDNHLLAVSYEGNYFLAVFDQMNGGECQIKKQLKFYGET